MAELNQNQNSNTIAYSNKQLFIRVLHRIYYTKSIGKFPERVAHASFLQCSAYIVLGQDDDLGKINFVEINFVEP